LSEANSTTPKKEKNPEKKKHKKKHNKKSSKGKHKNASLIKDKKVANIVESEYSTE
jgi:hypothetical protein